jgi:tRNA pseudouridine65 synthase
MSETESPANDPIDILYQDEQVLVADKPPGLLVHRSRESSDRVFLLQQLRDQVGRYLYPVQRLDRAASGAISFALSSEAARDLQASLTSTTARKEYLVLVRGSAADSGEIERPLTGANGKKKDALTRFEKIGEVYRSSLLRVRIFTGRRHQIRRHLAHLGHQIIGDTTYGKGKINRFLREEHGLPRMFLHCARLEFDHPGGAERVEVHAPLAEDLRAFLLGLPGCPAKILGEA